MSFNNRDEFVNAAASEKVVLAHVHASSRLYTWTLDSGSIYKRSVQYFVYNLKESDINLVRVSNYASLVEGSFYYDVKAGELYVWCTGSVDPQTLEMIGVYRFFFSDVSFSAPWDLTPTGLHTQYNGRIKSHPGYSHKVGIEQQLTSLVGSGTLGLFNEDGGLDQIFDTLFFENHECLVYSWNPELSFDEAKIIYRGRITNKSYTENQVSFTIKDQIFDLEQTLPQNVYTASDNVNTNVQGRYKRWVYGRVDGLKLQSIDQVGDGYTISGTVSGSPVGATLTGSGTSFLSEVSPGDRINIGTQEFTIDFVTNDTSLELDKEPSFAFTAVSATIVPEIPTRYKNRSFFVADHACATITRTVVSAYQLNRVEINDTTGLLAGDFVQFQSGERLEIKNVAPGNIIVLRQNLLTLPAVGSSVIRQPIQNVYISGKQILSEDFTLSNLGSPTNELKVTIDQDAEFNIARIVQVGVTLTFTNGSRVITGPASEDMQKYFKPRDWIRPANPTYSTFYEVLYVDETSVIIRTTFTDSTISDTAEAKYPDYVGDDGIVSANVLGKTVNGEPEGTWIFNASQAVKDLLSEIGVTNINSASFTQAESDAPQTISLALPTSTSGSVTKIKNAIDLINKSVNCVLTTDNNLDMQYRSLQNRVPDNPRIVKDSDVIDWKITTTNGKNFRSSVVKYKFTDIDRETLEEGSQAVYFESDFVKNYIGTQKTDEFDSYIYYQNSAQIMAERYVYFNRLSRSDITIKSDLRLEDIEIGDVIQIEFNRLYQRFGDTQTRKKLMMVVGLKKSGKSIELQASDLGNTFNTSAVIAPDSTNDYTSATVEEKLKYGFITDDRGIINNDEESANTNLIS